MLIEINIQFMQGNSACASNFINARPTVNSLIYALIHVHIEIGDPINGRKLNFHNFYDCIVTKEQLEIILLASIW